MFGKSLSNLSLSNANADLAFRNIQGRTFGDDRSFIATLRALLLPRVGEETVSMVVRSNTYRSSQINSVDRTVLFRDAFGRLDKGTLTVFNVRTSVESDRTRFMEVLDDPESGFLKIYNGYVELTNIRQFVANVMDARFYTNEERHSTVIVVNQLTIRKWHYLQAFTPRYFKWFFDSNPINEDEKNLLASLIQRNPQEYEQRIEHFAELVDLRSYMIKNALGDFEKRSREEQLRAVNAQIENTRRRMNELMQSYQSYIDELDNYNVRRVGLTQLINSEDSGSELIDYFLSNKTLDIIETDGSHIYFIVRTYLDAFDPEMYAAISRHDDSHLFRGYDVMSEVFSSPDSRKKLMDAIFSDDPELRIKCCAYYDLDIRGQSNSTSHYGFPPNCHDRLPNPHLQYHNCLGNHRRYINDRLVNGDLIGAIDQCISSAKSVNIGEDVTMHYFLRDLFASDEKILENSDGVAFTPAEALQWLNEKDGDTPAEEV